MLDHQHGVLTSQGLEKIRGQIRLLVGETGHRFIHQQQIRILTHEHGDLEPLLLAMGQRACSPVRAILQIDNVHQLMNTITLVGTETAEQQGPGLFWTADGQSQVLLNGELLEHPRALKLAPNAQAGNAVFTVAHQGASFEDHIALGRGGLARDHIEKRGLAGPVGTDHRPQLTGLKREVEIPQRQKTVKTDGDLTEFQQRLRHG